MVTACKSNFHEIKLPQGEMPDSVVRLLDYAVKVLNPKKIILFGSRAKGTANMKSDFDFAFELDSGKMKIWNKFLSDADELPLTLFKRDLINLNEASAELRKQILANGITLYE